MSLATLRRYGRQVVGHQDTIPVVSVADYFSGYLKDPAKQVRGHPDCLIALLTILGKGLLRYLVPNPYMDNKI